MNDQSETQTPIKTLNAFMEWVQQLENKEYLFRGLPCATYDIIASAYLRLNPEAGPEQLIELNKALIKDARLQGHDDRNGRKLSDLEVLAKLQHFRTATCLIDFTYSPLVALWFACQPTSEGDSDGKVSAVHNDPNKITAVTPDLLTTDTHIDHFFKADANGKYPLYRWQPSQLNNRIVSQHSVFVFGHEKIIEPDAECVVAADSKEDILESLRSFSHISDLTLFPDFDGFVRRRSYDIVYLQLSASEYWERGNRALQRGEYQLAINDYNKAIALRSDDADAHYSRGLAYSEISDFHAAIRDYTRAIELNPDDANPHYNRGFAYSEISDFHAAIRDYTRAIELNPDDADAHYSRGFAYSKISDFHAAIRDYTRAIELNPDDADAHYSRGFAYSEIGDLHAAIRDYTRAIELNPNDANPHYNRGFAYSEIGDLHAAIRDYTRAIELNPDDADAHCNRGTAKLNIGNVSEAEQDFQTALHLAKRTGDEIFIAQIKGHLRDMNADTGETQ